MASKSTQGYTQRDIAAILNNAVIYSLRPSTLEEIPEARLRQLRAYAMAVVEPLQEHVDEGFLKPEELVAVLASGALFTQLSGVMKTSKIPAAKVVEDLYAKK